MAGPWYINSNAGGANTGLNWTDAFNNSGTAWSDAITASSAGDDFYVMANSVTTNATAQTLTFKGTQASPNRVFSCTAGTTNTPPVTADLGVGAAFTTTATSAQTINGVVYIYGVTFNVGTNTTTVSFTLAGAANSDITLDTCQIKIPVTSASSSVNISTGTAISSKVTLINTPMFFNGGTGAQINLNNGPLYWRNTPSAIQGTQTALANLFAPQSAHCGVVVCDSVDFNGGTGIASGKNLVAASATPFYFQFRNCKITSGVLIAVPTSPFGYIDQIVTDSGATNWHQQRDTYTGQLVASSTIYNNATDGTTPISWKVVSTANAKPASPFECFDIVQWVAAGTYAASKVFLTSATASLKTNDVWVDVEYLGSNYALGSHATSFGAGSGTATLPQIPGGTTPGTLAAASPAWATSGQGNDYQLVIPSFTTSVAGYIRFSVKVGKASLTVYIDPAVTVA